MSSSHGNNIANNKTLRATGRIGAGTLVAMALHHYIEFPEEMHAPMTGVIILAVNEVSYVSGLMWKHFVKKVENWS